MVCQGFSAIVAHFSVYEDWWPCPPYGWTFLTNPAAFPSWRKQDVIDARPSLHCICLRTWHTCTCPSGRRTYLELRMFSWKLSSPLTPYPTQITSHDTAWAATGDYSNRLLARPGWMAGWLDCLTDWELKQVSERITISTWCPRDPLERYLIGLFSCSVQRRRHLTFDDVQQTPFASLSNFVSPLRLSCALSWLWEVDFVKTHQQESQSRTFDSV